MNFMVNNSTRPTAIHFRQGWCLVSVLKRNGPQCFQKKKKVKKPRKTRNRKINRFSFLFTTSTSKTNKYGFASTKCNVNYSSLSLFPASYLKNRRPTIYKGVCPPSSFPPLRRKSGVSRAPLPPGLRRKDIRRRLARNARGQNTLRPAPRRAQRPPSEAAAHG